MVTCHMLHVVQCLGQSGPANGPWIQRIRVILAHCERPRAERHGRFRRPARSIASIFIRRIKLGKPDFFSLDAVVGANKVKSMIRVWSCRGLLVILYHSIAPVEVQSVCALELVNVVASCGPFGAPSKGEKPNVRGSE
jgi:hypothetical protein